MKKVFFIIIVVLAILSISATSVGAAVRGTVQPGELDEDGDLVVGELAAMPISGASDFVAPTGGSAPIIADVVPVPYPMEAQAVPDKTPTFYFFKQGEAIRYRIRVWDIYTGTLFYKFKGDADCPGTVCTLTPDIALKVHNLNGTKGYYYWEVAARVGDEWGDDVYQTSFYVASTGFTSTFNIDANKWLSVLGEWFVIDPGYLKTKGVPGNYASAVQKQLMSDYYVYEVTMKRKADNSTNDYYSLNRIYFHGYPTPLASDGAWDDGYIFQYTNEGYWSLIKVVDGSHITLIPPTYSPYILPNDWNTLTVFTDTPFMDFWINGEYLDCTGIDCGYAEDTTFTAGWVGMGMYHSTEIAKTPLLVDKAELYYTNEPPYPWPWSDGISADGTRELIDPTFEFTPGH